MIEMPTEYNANILKYIKNDEISQNKKDFITFLTGKANFLANGIKSLKN